MSEQTQAEQRLREVGVYFHSMGFGFHVGGRFGRYMTPAEVLSRVR